MRPEIRGDKEPKKRFTPCPIGFFHIGIAGPQTAGGKLHLLIAIDRTGKSAFARRVASADRGQPRICAAR